MFADSSPSNGNKSKQNCKTSATQTEPILNKTLEASIQTEARIQNTKEISIQTEARSQHTLEASIQTEARSLNTAKASNQTVSKGQNTLEASIQTEPRDQKTNEASIQTEARGQNTKEISIQTEARSQNTLEARIQTEAKSQNTKEASNQTEAKSQNTTEASNQTEARSKNNLAASIQTKTRSQNTIEASIQTEAKSQNTLEASNQTDTRVLGTAFSQTNTSSDDTENTGESLLQTRPQNMPEATIETPALISNSLSFIDEVKNEDNNETDQFSNEEENITSNPFLQGENIQESGNKMESTGFEIHPENDDDIDMDDQIDIKYELGVSLDSIPTYTERQIDRKAETQKDKETKGQRDRETDLCGTQSAQHSDSANFENQTSFFGSLIKGSQKNTNGTQTVLNAQTSNNIGKKRTVQIRRGAMPEMSNKKRKIEDISSVRFKAEDGTIQIIKVSKDQPIEVVLSYIS